MPQTIIINCPWCKSKSQTMDIQCWVRATDCPPGLQYWDDDARALSLKCRACSGLSVATVQFLRGRSGSAGSDSSSDLTKLVEGVMTQVPQFDEGVSPHWPELVSDCMKDAHEARSPRAKCQSYRAAIEFAVRAAELEAKPGEPLGAILRTAKKNYAVSDALIELWDQIKAFGNWGLHWSEARFEDNDAEAAREISNSILSYLFDMPARVAEARARTEAAKEAHHSPPEG